MTAVLKCEPNLGCVQRLGETKKSLAREKTNFHATQEAYSDRKEDQYKEELMDKSEKTAEPKYADQRTNMGRMDDVSDKLRERGFGIIECDMIVGTSK